MSNQMTQEQVDTFFYQIKETAIRNGLLRQLEDWFWYDSIEGLGFVQIGIRGDKAVGYRAQTTEED